MLGNIGVCSPDVWEALEGRRYTGQPAPRVLWLKTQQLKRRVMPVQGERRLRRTNNDSIAS